MSRQTPQSPLEQPSLFAGANAPPFRGWRALARASTIRVAALVLGLIVAAVVAETTLWFLGIAPESPITKRYLVDENASRKVAYHCYSSNPNNELAPVPETFRGQWRLMTSMLEPRRLPLDDLRKTPWCAQYELSSLGLRHRELAPPGPGDRPRVLVVGDSFVFGEGVPYEQTVCRHLERAFDEKIEFINAGRPGLNTGQEVERLYATAPSLGCRQAIVVFTANDIDQTRELLARQDFINDLINIRDEYLSAAQPSMLKQSRVLGLALGAWRVRRAAQGTIDWYLDSYDPRHNAANLRIFESRLRGMATFPGANTVLVLYPLIEGLEVSYPLEEVHHRVSEMASASGLKHLDLAPFFARQNTASLWVHPTDHHPNARAHQLAAQTIAAWIRELPGFLELAQGAAR